MKQILGIVWKVPHVKRQLTLFFLGILVAQGLTWQLIPLIDREVNNLLEESITGSEIGINQLIPFAVATYIVTVVFFFFNFMSNNAGGNIRERVVNDLFMKGYEKLLNHDIAYLSEESSGKRLNQINRASWAIANLFTEASANFLRNFLQALGALIIIATIDWRFSVAILLIALVYFLMQLVRFKKDIPLAKQRDEISDKDFTRVWEVVPQAKLTKLFTNEYYEVSKLGSYTDKAITIYGKRQKLWAYADTFEALTIQPALILLRVCAAYQVLVGNFGIATFVLLYAMIDRAQNPLWVIDWFIWEMQNVKDRSKKYFEIMNSEEKILEVNATKMIDPKNLNLKLENVTFSYAESSEPVFKGLSIEFKENEFSALVGKSGSGKSTILNLLCRFYDPVDGKISIGNVDLREVSQKDLRSYIGFVFQESFVFSGSIRDNLRYGDMTVSDEVIVNALEKANAWEFVKVFKEGLDTEIGERGVKLSGGQRQRLAIARTLIKDPKILFLDEATNALDSESEVLVQDALEKFVEGRTVVSIAHRLSTIQNADKIFVLEDGDVKESGTHASLIAEDGVYKKLHDIQSGSYAESKQLLKEYELS